MGQPVQGNRQHDNTDRGSPVKIGGKASSSTPSAVAAGDRVDAYFDTTGRLVVKAENAAGGDLGGGTQYTEDDAAPANPTGTVPALIRDDTPNTQVSTDGDIVAQRGTNYGAAYVQVVTSSGSFVDAFGGSGGTAQADESAFTEGTTNFTPIGGVLNDTIVSDPTEDQAAAARITAKRAIHVNLRDASGNEVSVGGGTQYDEDTASAAAEKVTMAGVVRKDTAATLVDTDGDRTEMQVDATGLLRVNASGVAVPVTDNGGNLSVDDGGGSLTVDGTVSVSGAVDTELTTADLDTGAGTDTRAVVGLVGAASGGGALIEGTAANGLEVDVTRVQGNVTVVDGGSTISVDDGAGSLTVDNATLSVTGGGVESGALRVTLANDSTGVVSVDDNGGSLTVDGTVSVSGAVDTELPAAAALADNSANPTAPAVGSHLMGFDGTTWDRVRADGGSVFIQDGGNVISVDDAAGSLTVDNAALSVVGGGVEASALRVTIASDSTGVLSVDDNGGSLTVDGTVTANAGTGNFNVIGPDAHDAAVSANPVVLAGRASTADPSAVSADGDVVRLWADRYGRQVVQPGSTIGEAVTKTAQYTTAQTGTALWTPAGSNRVVVQYIQIQVGGTTAGNVQVWFGASADTTYTRGTDKAIFDGEFAPSATLKPGFTQTKESGWVGAVDDILRVTTSAAMTITVTCWGYEIA